MGRYSRLIRQKNTSITMIKPRGKNYQPDVKGSYRKWIKKALVSSSFIAVLYSSLVVSPFNEVHTVRTAADRRLSISYGDGTCKWQPPMYDVPEDIDFWKTIVVGFPSGDKRLSFIQMEALTGWPAKDEWDFKHIGMSNHPFIKANYPHHEGTWGWQDAGDQVVMVVRNIRRAMVEYHDILWDIGYAKTWADAFEKIPNLYADRPPLEDFLEWRDLRVLDEIYWYGWFIDYWMEGGLKRDIYSHNLTTHEHWALLTRPGAFSRAYHDETFVPTTEEFYDSHCVTEVTNGCQPVKIISAEKLVQHDTGPAENRKIAEVLTNHEGMREYVIEESAWECIWTELIINKKGVKTFIDRPGYTEQDYGFSSEMLEAMIAELDRLITKYSAPEWFVLEISRDLVALLDEHRTLLRAELEGAQNIYTRRLSENDFLGPRERERRRAASRALSLAEESTRKTKKRRSKQPDNKKYFKDLDVYLAESREKVIRKEQQIEADYFRRNK